MGISQNVFIGPYAEFPVPIGRAEDFPPRDEGGDVLGWQQLLCNRGLEGRPPDYYRYTPTEAGPPGRNRQMFFTGKGVWIEDQDLTDLDRHAEMDWFVSACADPLRLLSEKFGVSP